ncbi:gluconokinase [Pararhizobium sp. YC-54]|uniref:gluconokinase n=1 Tax=Pararhizobium sp. YC-54 TaxID=2986920 RepID=UPI0021F7FB91|nr:gluconokinase [Pararhizobium sp. YC-54]MCV9996869.1 gluconokinase [Pararhizobium sp. YC-54]
MVAIAIRAAEPKYVLVMGVCGVGKSTIAQEIADRVGGTFVEADDHHSAGNKQTMIGGTPLTDEQRWPWLEAVANAASDEFSQNGEPVFIACSALKRRYRAFLREKLGSLSIVYLSGAPELIRRRLEDRQSHFMPPRLLDSQLSDLEEPGPDEEGITVDIDCDPEHLVREICERLGLGGSHSR